MNEVFPRCDFGGLASERRSRSPVDLVLSVPRPRVPFFPRKVTGLGCSCFQAAYVTRMGHSITLASTRADRVPGMSWPFLGCSRWRPAMLLTVLQGPGLSPQQRTVSTEE